MANYYVRRTRNNVVEDSAYELKSSHLFLIRDARTDNGRTFVLKWLIDRAPTSLMSGVVYAAHYVRFDKTIHRLRIARFESVQRRIHYLVGMTPFWGDGNKVSFRVVEEDFELQPEAPSIFNNMHVPDRKCFFEFVEPFTLKNTLQIMVTMECGDSLLDIDINRHSELVPDLQNLMDSSEFSDFTMVVGGEEFRLHIAILSARSPVFKAMFSNDMLEKNTGRLVIEDSPDGRTFRQFIRYMYTGKTEPLDSEQALGLLEWADKYQVKDLKSEVVEFLTHNLDKKNVLSVYVIADATIETHLKMVASSYIAEHLNVLMQSSDWSLLVKNRADLLEDILRNFAY